MSNWWKSPVLQGEDNDYGQYDYLIEELPKATAEWCFGRVCDSCGKYRRAVFVYTNYFYTLDGYDSMEFGDCWLCRIKSKVHNKIWKLKRKWRAIKQAMSCIVKEKRYGIKDFGWLYRLFVK